MIYIQCDFCKKQFVANTAFKTKVKKFFHSCKRHIRETISLELDTIPNEYRQYIKIIPIAWYSWQGGMGLWREQNNTPFACKLCGWQHKTAQSIATHIRIDHLKR